MSDMLHTVLTGAGTVKNGTKGGAAFSSDFSNDFDIGGDFSNDFHHRQPDPPPEVRRAALQLVGAAEVRRDALFEVTLAYAKRTDEWRRTLTDDETTRWEGRLQGYADAVNLAAPCPFTDDTPAEIAAALARGCGKFSLLPSQQRMRAYKRAAKAREKRASDREAVLQDHAAGLSIRKIAARRGVPRSTVQRMISTANGTLVDNSLSTANGTPCATPKTTANGTLSRPVCRPRDPKGSCDIDQAGGLPLPQRRGDGPTGASAFTLANNPKPKVGEQKGSKPTDKAGGCGRGQPSPTVIAPPDATSHPLVKRPPATEPASGCVTIGDPEVGQRLDEVLRSLVNSKRSVHEGPPDSPTITDPERIAKRERAKEQWTRAAAQLGGEA